MRSGTARSSPVDATSTGTSVTTGSVQVSPRRSPRWAIAASSDGTTTPTWKNELTATGFPSRFVVTVTG